MKWTYTIRFPYAGTVVDIAWAAEFDAKTPREVEAELKRRGLPADARIMDIRRAYGTSHLNRNDYEWGHVDSMLRDQKAEIYATLKRLADSGEGDE